MRFKSLGNMEAWPAFGRNIDFADIFSGDTHAKKLDPADKINRHDDRSPSRDDSISENAHVQSPISS